MTLVRGGIAVKPHVQAFADACQAATGADSYGTYNGHSPPEGPTQALDIFNTQTDDGYRLQAAIADFAIKNQQKFGVRYVIKWNPSGRDFIWNIERADEGWRAMATRDHPDHVHLTFYATAEAKPEPEPKKKEEAMAKAALGVYDWNGRTWITDGMFTRPTNDPYVYLNAGLAEFVGKDGKLTEGQHGELIERDTLARKPKPRKKTT